MRRKLVAAGIGVVGALLLAVLFGLLTDHLMVPAPAAALVANNSLDTATGAFPAIASTNRLKLARLTPTPLPTVLVALLPTPQPVVVYAAPAVIQAPAEVSVVSAAAVVAPPVEVVPAVLGATEGVVNGLPQAQIVVLSDAARARVREVYARGRQMGRDPNAFSKVGDSTMVWPPFLADFTPQGDFNLGPYAYLQPTLDYFQDSYGRKSVATVKGMHTWTQFDPTWADPQQCAPGEGPLACEFRLHNPSVMIIRLGANDVGAPELFNSQLRRIVDFCLERGVVPILGTKPDRSDGPDNTLNRIVHRIAQEYDIPLWDYDLVAGTVPGRGLEPDQIHMRAGDTHDFNLPAAYQSGDPLEDLTALMALDVVRQLVTQ